MDAVERYRMRRDSRLNKRMDEFNEGDHPRDKNGQFKSTGGSESKQRRQSEKPKMSKEELTERIARKLDKKYAEAGYRRNPFTINMKSGNKITVAHKSSRAKRVLGRWYSGKSWIEVTGDGIDGTKYFKSMESLAKAMAYGYIK